MDTPPAAMVRYLAVWNGEATVDELDSILSPAYRGYMGSRARTAAELRQDILDYRDRVPGVRFRWEHQFGEGEHIATRVTAHAVDAATGNPMSAIGINISRWKDGLLAEEWAVWEPFDRKP